jgi:hypothetical protein
MENKRHNGVQYTLYRGCEYKKEGCPTCYIVDSMLHTHSDTVHSPYILTPSPHTNSPVLPLGLVKPERFPDFRSTFSDSVNSKLSQMIGQVYGPAVDVRKNIAEEEISYSNDSDNEASALSFPR